MSKVLELFGKSTKKPQANWAQIVGGQQCPFIRKQCYKIRKSDPGTSIGTCTVAYGRELEPVVICPTRLNELHVVSEITIPGGSVDFFLVSARNGKVKDFVGVELQTLDTTGTVWPERQRLLKELGLPRSDKADSSNKAFGMNWKMTAKTILVQMHHKVQTFEHINKRLVLVVQDRLLSYMSREFKFDHLRNPAAIGDSMHLHAYKMTKTASNNFQLNLQSRLSTDAEGIAMCLGLQAEARVELTQIIATLESKISKTTRFRPV
jgi:Restriction endonuclease NotI